MAQEYAKTAQWYRERLAYDTVSSVLLTILNLGLNR
jgi:hypothetical protein